MDKYKKLFKKIFVSSFVRNATVLVIGTVLSMLIQIGTSPILTRLYTHDQWGIFQGFISCYSILLIIATARFELAIVIPEDDDEALQITVLSSVISILFSGVLMLILLLSKSILFNNFNYQISNWMYFLPPTIAVLGVYYSCNYWLNRKKKFLNLAINRVLQALLATVLAILFATRLHSSQNGLITSYFYAQLIALVLFVIYTVIDIVKAKTKFRISTLINVAKRYRNFPKYMMPAGVVNNFAAQVPVILLGLFYGTAITGQYAIMNRVLAMPITVISQAVADVFRQRASSTYVAKGECLSLYRSTIKGLSLMSILPFAVLMIFSKTLIPFIFGSSWHIAATYVIIMAPFYWVRFVASPLTFMTVIAKRQDFEMKWQIVMMIFTTIMMALGQFIFHSHYMMLVMYAFAFIVMYLIHVSFTYRLAGGYKK